MTWQDEMFAERLVRLDLNARRTKRPNGRWSLWYKGSDQRWTLDFSRTVSVLGAGLIGFLSVPLSRLAIFQSRGLGDSSNNPEMVMAIDGIFSFCIAYFLVRMMLVASSKTHMISQVAGIWIALVTMHNFVHAQPDLWAQAFSPEWVKHTLTTTEPNTLFLLHTGLR